MELVRCFAYQYINTVALREALHKLPHLLRVGHVHDVNKHILEGKHNDE